MAAVTPIRTPAEAGLIEAFENAPAPDSARAAAMEKFKTLGLPHRRLEPWKYTDLRALLRAAPPPAAAGQGPAAPAAFAFGETEAHLICGGRWRGLQGGAAQPGVIVARGGDAALEFPEGESVIHLNRAFAPEVITVTVAPGARLAKPLRFAFSEPAEPALIAARLVVRIGAGAEAGIIETHECPDGAAHFINSAIELEIGEGANVQHARVNLLGAGATCVSTFGARLGAGAELSSLNFAIGGAVSRHQAFVTCAGEGVKLSLRGASLASGRQHTDATLTVDHAEPHCESRELFRTVLDDEASGVFQGKIIVRPNAQKTDGRMAANAILLADGAAMSNKPELEIFADDVQCAHGVTSGALDDSLVFYLMARGIPRKEAEALMIASFLGEAIEPVAHEGLREALNGLVQKWLQERAAR